MKSKIAIIAAMDEERGIGKDNKIAWHIKEDLAHLKDLTAGHVVIIGRKSYDSMVWYYDKNQKPMPGKVYIVVTRDQSYAPSRENATVAKSVEKAIEKTKEYEQDTIYVIGGQQIFEQTIGIANMLYLTIIKGSYDADAFFPEYEHLGFKLVKKEERESDGYQYSFIDLEK